MLLKDFSVDVQARLEEDFWKGLYPVADHWWWKVPRSVRLLTVLVALFSVLSLTLALYRSFPVYDASSRCRAFLEYFHETPWRMIVPNDERVRLFNPDIGGSLPAVHYLPLREDVDKARYCGDLLYGRFVIVD